MLKKLFIHEWKDSWKLVTLFNGIMIVFTIIGVILMLNGNWLEAIERNESYVFVYLSCFMLYYFAILALGIATNIYFFVRFYKSFYTDQGYLMHTLPVKSSQLILSKGLVMCIWEAICGVVIFLSISVLLNGILATSEEGYDIFLLFKEIFSWFEFTPSDIVLTILAVFFLIGCQIFSILLGYLAISLGQLSKNYKLLASIGIYMGMQTVLQIALSCFQIGMNHFVTTIDDVRQGMLIAVVLLFTIVVYAVDVAMYAGSNYIMKNKLNLE